MSARLCLITLAAGLWLGACGHDDPVPTQPAKKPKDAGSDQVPDLDGDVPLPRKDASVDMLIPGMPDPGLNGTCAIDSNKIYTVLERDQPITSTPLAVDPINSHFVLPYVATGKCIDAVNMSSLDGDATSGAPKSSVASDACAIVNTAVAAALNSGWLLASVDNRQGAYDVWVAPYDIARNKADAAHRISQSPHVETNLALAALRSGESALLAWSDEDAGAGQTLYVRPLDKTGMPSGDAVQIEHSSTLYYQGLGLRALGADGAGLVYLRSSEDYKTSDIVFVALDKNGKPVRNAWVLADNVGPSPSVDLAIDEMGGGIVYARGESETGRQLWFQQIDDTGQAAMLRSGARAPALRFVNAPFKGIDVAITKLSASYAVAYRALPALDQTRAQIRLYFLDRYGAVIGSSDVSYTSPSGGRTAIASAYDGRVVVGWSQVNENGKSITQLVRLPCVGG
jgi:hypothetical protein